VGIVSLFKAMTASLVLTPLLLFGLPILDTSVVLLGRWFRGAPLFQADQSHLHHRLMRLGLNPKQATLFLYAVTLILAALALDISSRQAPEVLLFGMALLAVLVGLVWFNRRASALPPSPAKPKD
jgi:UDP-GlcNAc:undecaprenyl-phosphate GlcNAc-1-phosphate transferase